MTEFLFSKYNGQLVKVKLKDDSDILIGKIISVGGLQSFQAADTTGNAATLEVIKNINTYKKDPGDLENVFIKRIYSEDVESIQVISSGDL